MGVDLLNIKGLNEIDHPGPVVMVNLMRFRERSLDGDGSGWDAYLRYSALTVPMIKARGGTLLWTGDARAVAIGESDLVSGSLRAESFARPGKLFTANETLVSSTVAVLAPAAVSRVIEAVVEVLRSSD